MIIMLTALAIAMPSSAQMTKKDTGNGPLSERVSKFWKKTKKTLDNAADQVRKDMKEICPEYLEMSKLAQSIDVAEAKEDVVYMFSDAIYSSANDAIAMLFHRKSSGSDGHGVWSSLDGGGGYSGGGGGGGR